MGRLRGSLGSEEAKGLGLHCRQQSELHQRLAGVERDVQPRNAGVGRGETLVVRWADHDAGWRLVGVDVGREGGAARPEVE